jgi:hypothetical protein
LASNPVVSQRLKKAGITSAGYSYGEMGYQSCTGQGAYPWFTEGAIVGFSQTGSALTIVSFSSYGTEDQNTAGSVITYTLID